MKIPVFIISLLAIYFTKDAVLDAELMREYQTILHSKMGIVDSLSDKE